MIFNLIFRTVQNGRSGRGGRRVKRLRKVHLCVFLFPPADTVHSGASPGSGSVVNVRHNNIRTKY